MNCISENKVMLFNQFFPHLTSFCYANQKVRLVIKNLRNTHGWNNCGIMKHIHCLSLCTLFVQNWNGIKTQYTCLKQNLIARHIHLTQKKKKQTATNDRRFVLKICSSTHGLNIYLLVLYKEVRHDANCTTAWFSRRDYVKRYSVSIRIQSEYEKIRTRKTLDTEDFHAVVIAWL